MLVEVVSADSGGRPFRTSRSSSMLSCLILMLLGRRRNQPERNGTDSRVAATAFLMEEFPGKCFVNRIADSPSDGQPLEMEEFLSALGFLLSFVLVAGMVFWLAGACFGFLVTKVWSYDLSKYSEQ
jgi:hypothetical protein